MEVHSGIAPNSEPTYGPKVRRQSLKNRFLRAILDFQFESLLANMISWQDAKKSRRIKWRSQRGSNPRPSRFTGTRFSRKLEIGGAGGVRTRDLLDAIEARSQLRYGPTECKYCKCCYSVYSTLRIRASNNSSTIGCITQRLIRASEQELCRYDQKDYTPRNDEDAGHCRNRHACIGTLHMARGTALAGVHVSSITCFRPSCQSGRAHSRADQRHSRWSPS